MASSSVTLGPSGQPGRYAAAWWRSSGNRVVARLASSGARAVLLRLCSRIDAGGAVTGRPAPGVERMTGAHALPRLLRGVQDGGR